MGEKALALTGVVLTGPPEKIQTAITKWAVSMSEKTNPEAALAYIDMVCKATKTKDLELGRLRNLLGRMVLSVRQHKLYQPRFEFFKDYVDSLEKEHGLKSTSIYNAMDFVDLLLPDQASLEQAPAGISIRTQATAVSAARKVETTAQRREILKFATLPEPLFRQKMEEKGYLTKQGRPEGGKRETGTVNLSVPGVSAKVAQRFRTAAKEYGSPAKYLNHLLGLDRKAEAA